MRLDVMWSEEDGEFVATSPDAPSLSWLDSDPFEAGIGLLQIMKEFR